MQLCNVLVLEGFTGYQTGKRLIFFALSVRLPPVGILLRDHVQHVTFLEADTQLSTGNIRIFFRIVVKVGPYMLDLIETHRCTP